jgi:regulator of protease activity HflC (stomatin/prohibitin superfamily)
MKKQNVIALLIVTIMMTSCTVIRPGQVGVKQKVGKLSDTVLDEGAHSYNFFTTKIVRATILTQNLELDLNLPSKEGLNVGAEISILYRVERDKVPSLIESVGLDYESIIRSVFRSASADVCAQFFAKDMHSGMRGDIELDIKNHMARTLTEKGLIIEAVLMKTIKLPPGLYNSIENKMEAEQDAMRMQFVLQQERSEAERKIIEAEGTRDAQIILSEGLTREILQLKSIEAFLKLSESDGSKVIISGAGEIPLMLED